MNADENNDGTNEASLSRMLGFWEVMVAGLALVVAGSTLAADLHVFLELGGLYVAALVLACAFGKLLMGLLGGRLRGRIHALAFRGSGWIRSLLRRGSRRARRANLRA